VLHRDRIVKLLSLIISIKKLGRLHERVNSNSCRNSLKHREASGGTRPVAQALGAGASAHCLQLFKSAIRPKAEI